MFVHMLRSGSRQSDKAAMSGHKSFNIDTTTRYYCQYNIVDVELKNCGKTTQQLQSSQFLRIDLQLLS